MTDYDKRITPERMQEIGAYIVSIGDNGPLTRPVDRMRYEKWQLPTNQGAITIFHDWHTGLWHIQRVEAIPFRFEHTFRDILKLMNIYIPEL